MVVTPRIIPGAEPFYFPGGQIGCVLIHGFTGTPKEMRELGEYLNKKGFTVLGIRLVGHAIQPDDMIRTRWQDWIASVEDGFNYLQDSCEKVFLVGLSMGGILSLVCGSYLPVRGIAAMSTPFSLPDDWRLRVAKLLSVIVPWIDKGKPDTKDKKSIETHLDYPRYPTRSIAELNKLTEKLHQSLENIAQPVLLINSKSDRTVHLNHAEKIESLLSNSACVERVTLDSSGHVITEDIEKETVFNAVFNFLKKNS
jgi:carboxylesterase